MKSPRTPIDPSRNFCTMGACYVDADPLDRKEKLALVNYVAGGTGALLLIDPDARSCESFPLPADNGGWALCFLKEEGTLLVGTCAQSGFVHRFNLKTRRFEESLRIDGEQYIWNFTRAKNGKVYGGTYPGCVLVEYDPATRSLRSCGKVSKDPENCYGRRVFSGAGGSLLIYAGFHTDGFWRYDPETEAFRQIGEEGEELLGCGAGFVATRLNGAYRIFDPFTYEVMETLSEDGDLDEIQNGEARAFLKNRLAEKPFGVLPGEAGNMLIARKDGRRAGIKGQDVFVEQKDGSFDVYRIPAEAPAGRIMTICAGPDGDIWGSSEFGQTIFRYAPESGALLNTSCVAKAGGEVYGMVWTEGRLWLTAYVGGDHIVYDPQKLWNQYGNENPKTLRSVAPEMVRPHGKSVLGPDGGIWTGWYASYGSYGGGITRIDPGTQEVKSWFQLVPGQAIEGIAASDKALYAVTSGEASGLPPKKEPFSVLKLCTDGSITIRKEYPVGTFFRSVAVMGNRVFVSAADTPSKTCRLLILNGETLEEEKTVILGSCDPEHPMDAAPCAMVEWKGTMAVFLTDEARFYQPDGSLAGSCRLSGKAGSAVVGKDGKLWFSIGAGLWVFDEFPA